MTLNTAMKTGDNVTMKPLLKPTIISITIHILLALYFITTQYHSENTNKSNDNNVEVTLIYDNKQIVEQLGNNNKHSENASFLSNADNFTERQTKRKFSHGIVGNMPQNQIVGTIPTKHKNFDYSGLHKRAIASDLNETEYNYLEIEEGSETILNTREFLYFTYYLRIKQQLQGYWEHYIKQKINELIISGNSYLGLNKRAKLLIVLDETGHLTNVDILDKSGFTGLDEAAMNAVQDANPFPPPPKGLLQDNEVMIAWEFILYNNN